MDNQEFHNIQSTNILKANKLSGLLPGLRDTQIKKVRVFFLLSTRLEGVAWELGPREEVSE